MTRVDELKGPCRFNLRQHGSDTRESLAQGFRLGLENGGDIQQRLLHNALLHLNNKAGTPVGGQASSAGRLCRLLTHLVLGLPLRA